LKLLDTNICIYIIKNKPLSVLKKFKEHQIGELSISSITVAELYFGAYNSQFIEKNLQIVKNFLIPFDIVEFDEKSAIEYAKIKAYLRKKGEVIGELDMQISAIGIANNFTIVTNNTKEFKRVENLKLENWI